MAFDLGKPSGLTRKAPLGRGDPSRLGRAAPLPKRSAKKAAADRRRSKAVHARYGDHPPCVAGPVWADADQLEDLARHEARALDRHTCRRLADDGHEVLTRGRGGSAEDTDNVLPACRPCHDLIGHLPALADRVGLTRPSEPGT